MSAEQLEAAWSAVRDRQREVIEQIANPPGCCDGGRCHPAEPSEPAQPMTSDEISDGLAAVEFFSDFANSIASSSHMRPGTGHFMSVLKEMADLHLRKTLDYGSDEDALANIRNSADVINVPAWAGAVLRMSDKMHRLRSYFRRGEVEFDGIPDTLLDLAAYAVIALVLYREQADG